MGLVIQTAFDVGPNHEYARASWRVFCLRAATVLEVALVSKFA